MKTAFLFPGQGAQSVGMCKDIIEQYPVAAEIFSRANEIVGYDLSEICFGGPAEALNSTKVSQPGIFTASAAILEVLRTESAFGDINPDITAGLSLGEYTAIYAAGAMSFEQGLKLVQQRGDAMQAAADATDGAMVSLIGLDEQKVAQLCEEASQGEPLVGVNYNCPGQIVISGSTAACERALGLADKYGAMKAIKLAVAGAFHSELMDSAAKTLEQALASSEISQLKDVKVLANINAEYYKDPDDIRSGLVKQLTSPILWQKCMEKLLDEGYDRFYEIGPGRVLTGLMKRINRKIKVINLSSSDALQKLQNG